MHETGFFAGFRTRDGDTVGMPFEIEDAESLSFIHASRLDGAGEPIARGYVKLKGPDFSDVVYDFIMWPEAVPFYPAKPS